MKDAKDKNKTLENTKQMQGLFTPQSTSHSTPTDRGMNLPGAKRQGEANTEK